MARLDQAIRTALTRPAPRERLVDAAVTPLSLHAAALAARIAEDNARWEALIRQAGIQPD